MFYWIGVFVVVWFVLAVLRAMFSGGEPDQGVLAHNPDDDIILIAGHPWRRGDARAVGYVVAEAVGSELRRIDNRVEATLNEADRQAGARATIEEYRARLVSESPRDPRHFRR